MKTSKPSDRILFVFGQGLSAWQGCDLLFLFSHAGFSTYAAIHDCGLPWVSPNVLRQLSGHSVFSAIELPNWVSRPDEFKLAIGIGLPCSFVEEFATRTTVNPVLELMAKKSRETVFFLDANQAVPDTNRLAVEKAGIGIRYVPEEIGKKRSAFEKGFSWIISNFRRKAIFGKFSARIQRTIPKGAHTLETDVPEWPRELEQRIFSAGFSLCNDGSPPDLLIETWDGPNPVKRSPGRKADTIVSEKPVTVIGKNRFSFDPCFYPQLSEARLKLRFVDSGATDFSFEKFVSEDTWLLIREPKGDLLLADRNGTRHIPNLGDRPAFDKLLDILAMTFASQLPVKID